MFADIFLVFGWLVGCLFFPFFLLLLFLPSTVEVNWFKGKIVNIHILSLIIILLVILILVFSN